MANEKDSKYEFKARDLIPVYGLASNLARYTKDSTPDDDLKFGVSLFGLVFYNALMLTSIIPSTLEKILK